MHLSITQSLNTLHEYKLLVKIYAKKFKKQGNYAIFL